jgi:hypothetical protein
MFKWFEKNKTTGVGFAVATFRNQNCVRLCVAVKEEIVKAEL